MIGWHINSVLKYLNDTVVCWIMFELVVFPIDFSRFNHNLKLIQLINGTIKIHEVINWQLTQKLDYLNHSSKTTIVIPTIRYDSYTDIIDSAFTSQYFTIIWYILQSRRHYIKKFLLFLLVK